MTFTSRRDRYLISLSISEAIGNHQEPTAEQLEILQEVQSLVSLGEQQLNEIDREMAQLEEKWQKIGKERRAKGMPTK